MLDLSKFKIAKVDGTKRKKYKLDEEEKKALLNKPNFNSISMNQIPTEIIKEYAAKIEQEGFDLTFEELAQYFNCTYDYARSNNTIKDDLQYVYINASAKYFLYELEKSGEIDLKPATRRLMEMRYLFKRSDFERFVKTHVQIENKYLHFTLEDFKQYPKFNTLIDLINFKNIALRNNQLIKLLNLCAKSSYKKTHYVYYSEIQEVPERLLTLKEVMKRLTLKHTMQAHRLIEKLGINRYCFGGLVRYNWNDFLKISDGELAIRKEPKDVIIPFSLDFANMTTEQILKPLIETAIQIVNEDKFDLYI